MNVSSEFIADLNPGACHTVIGTVAEIGMRCVRDLHDATPVRIDTVTGGDILTEQETAAQCTRRLHPIESRYS